MANLLLSRSGSSHPRGKLVPVKFSVPSMTLEVLEGKANECALPRLLLKRGLIGPNLGEDGEPRYRLAAAPKTHAHPVRVWSLL